MWWKRKRQDFQAEIDAHLQLEADELRSEGVHSEDAHAAAQRALGNRAAIEERFYESTPWMPFEHALRDLKYAARVLRKDAAFTALAIAVLALSIGGNTAIFSLVNAMLLRPLKIQNPEQIVGCYSVDAHPPGFSRGFSYTNYIDLRENNPVFTSVAAHGVASVGVGTAEGGTTHRVGADIVSSNYFATLGVPLFKGRPFTTDEERPDSGAPVVILSYSYWKKTGADPEAVGKPLRINGRTFSVVGITPEGFTGTMALVSSELYLPLGAYAIANNDFEHSLKQRDLYSLISFGRLKPGLTVQQADAQLAVVASQMAKAFPLENRDQTLIVQTLSRLGVSPNPSPASDLSESKIPVILLMSMAAVVLSIASLNLANMMLARGTARRKEIAIRLAIGGGRSRIVRQLFTEGFLLACLGGSAGLLVASGGCALLIRSLATIAPMDIVFFPAPDVRVLAATLGFCLLSTVVFGLWPAWRLTRPDLVSDLKISGAEDAGGGTRLFSRRNALVIAQLSLSLMMLAAAGLFVRSEFRAANIEPGFTLANEVLVEVDPSLAGYDETQGRRIYSALLPRLRSIPTVESVGLAHLVPFGNEHWMFGLHRAGDKQSDAPAVGAHYNVVSDDYFKTLGIPLLRGRAFRAAENSMTVEHRVAIIDQLAAQRLWPDSDAIGKQINFNSTDAEVVGVVGEVREQIIGESTAQPHVYVPFGQAYQADMRIHMKVTSQSSQAQALLLETIRREIRAVDDRVPVLTLKTLSNHMDTSLDLWLVKTGARMLGIFASVAILLAMIGLYAVKAYTVARRTREIGIRMAVGAGSADVLRMVLREGLGVTAIGVAGGVILALASGRLLAGMLYEVQAVDLTVLSLATLLLTAISLLACYLPARKAAHIDPMAALRFD